MSLVDYLGARNPKLSICISTYNRAHVIGYTLENILEQITDGCEIVISDNASHDNTEQVVNSYVRRSEKVRYVRQPTNEGVDRNYDRAVAETRGEYCWLMPDDDYLKPGAIASVLSALASDYSLVLLNVEIKDHRMLRTLFATSIAESSDRVFPPGTLDGLFSAVHWLIGYMGCIVIKRSIWLERDRESYYGTFYIHIGVLFQAPFPEKTLLIAKPSMSVRAGPQSWSRRYFEIALIGYTKLVQSLPLSEEAKSTIGSMRPWENLRDLLFCRALGSYSMIEYRKHIRLSSSPFRKSVVAATVAMIPIPLAYTLMIAYLSKFDRESPMAAVYLEFLKHSSFSWFKERGPHMRPSGERTDKAVDRSH